MSAICTRPRQLIILKNAWLGKMDKSEMHLRTWRTLMSPRIARSLSMIPLVVKFLVEIVLNRGCGLPMITEPAIDHLARFNAGPTATASRLMQIRLP